MKMQYLIMLSIVVMLAVADIVTGFIKGYVTDKPRSKKMRIGGMHKLAEIVVMCTAIGLEVGIDMLGKYYDAAQLANIVGGFTAFAVFAFISVMEVLSILENYVELNPDAAWAAKLIKSIKKKSYVENSVESVDNSDTKNT